MSPSSSLLRQYERDAASEAHGIEVCYRASLRGGSAEVRIIGLDDLGHRETVSHELAGM
jgi:hypothetical protein